MDRAYNIVIEKGDCMFFGYCPDVPGANGQDETVEACEENIREAVALILLDYLEDGLRDTPTDVI